jgi:crotonobetainyl-CoA:carnitine CoA-transferase CaiB-like acyl-CoA transferase
MNEPVTTTDREAVSNMTERSETPLPLAGVRVLDIATFIAAPFCGAIMGEFGAEVIKVEQPSGGDPLRQWGTPSKDGDSLVWLSEARNKKSITLDLRTPQGAAIFRELVAKADVVLENFRPGTLERWGIGFADLLEVNPRLVMLRITGFGQTGPYRNRPGYARIVHAFSGLSYLAREPGGTPVLPGSTSLADYISGLYGCVGVLMALRVRDRSGHGQFIDIGLYETVFRMMDEMASAFELHGVVREPMGADTVNIVPHSHYEARDKKWVAIACSSDRMFQRLAAAMGRPELSSDPRYKTMRQRDAHRAEVNRMVADWTAGLTAQELIRTCEEAEMACGLLYNVQDIFSDPQFAARENIVRLRNTRVGDFCAPAVLPKLSSTPGRFNEIGPKLGEHNEGIYSSLLQMSDSELADLKQSGVI